MADKKVPPRNEDPDDRDDRIDYRQMYPIPLRTPRGFAARKNAPTPKETAGSSARHFADRPIPNKREVEIGKSYEEDRPRKRVTPMIKELMSADPDMKLADLMTELAARGYIVSQLTAGTIRADFLETIRIAVAKGYVRIRSNR
jgi:hypothetical protein